MRFGRFTVLDHLGTGGMGTVLAAYDGVLDRRIALKLLRPAVDADQVGEANARLLREAQALARVIHPNIVTIHEAGVIADAVYLAMEFVDGVTLRAWLRTERTQAELLSVFATAARALHGAHQAGVVHRDFKPDNVMISADARGELHLPYVRFTDALRVRTTVTSTPAVGGASVVVRQSQFFSECFGEIGRATSRPGEPADDFTTAATLRRLAL